MKQSVLRLLKVNEGGPYEVTYMYHEISVPKTLKLGTAMNIFIVVKLCYSGRQL
jgi:hypothetical protein